MSVEELRTKFLTQFIPPPVRKRNYVFTTRHHLQREKNRKQRKLTSVASLTVLCALRKCCVDKCITYFTKEQLIQERVKYLIYFLYFRLRCAPVHRRQPYYILTTSLILISTRFAILTEKEKTLSLRAMCRAAFRRTGTNHWFEFFALGISVCCLILLKVTLYFVCTLNSN
jgi:hypothetical protein